MYTLFCCVVKYAYIFVLKLYIGLYIRLFSEMLRSVGALYPLFPPAIEYQFQFCVHTSDFQWIAQLSTIASWFRHEFTPCVYWNRPNDIGLHDVKCEHWMRFISCKHILCTARHKGCVWRHNVVSPFLQSTLQCKHWWISPGKSQRLEVTIPFSFVLSLTSTCLCRCPAILVRETDLCN